MPSCRHRVVAAGLALGLSVTPQLAAPSQACALSYGQDASAGAVSYDKADFYDAGSQEAALASEPALARALAPMQLSDEMKYFAKYESSCNYDQGFSSGDGYNALGYYQFDRRYGLVDFMQACLSYNPQTYSAFSSVVSRGDEVKTGRIYDSSSRRLTELGAAVEGAWHAAYGANPAEFSALQDAWAYEQYFAPTASWFSSQGIDITGRADCVKGLVWGASNLFGPTGARWFFRGAGLSSSMTDEQFVSALCDYIVNNVALRYPSQPQYWAGWQNRYRQEKAACLAYLAAAPDKPGAGETDPDKPGGGGEVTPDPSEPDVPGTGESTPSVDTSKPGLPDVDTSANKTDKVDRDPLPAEEAQESASAGSGAAKGQENLVGTLGAGMSQAQLVAASAALLSAGDDGPQEPIAAGAPGAAGVEAVPAVKEALTSEGDLSSSTQEPSEGSAGSGAQADAPQGSEGAPSSSAREQVPEGGESLADGVVSQAAAKGASHYVTTQPAARRAGRPLAVLLAAAGIVVAAGIGVVAATLARRRPSQD